MKIYYSKEARETASNQINRLYKKLAKTTPTDQWPLQDIESLMYYLRTLKDAVEGEQRELDRKYRDIKRKQSNKP